MIKEVLKRLETVAGLNDEIEKASDGKWFRSLDRDEQRQYIKEHPKSKYAKRIMAPNWKKMKYIDDGMKTCPMCGRRVDESEMTYYDGDYMCQDCADRELNG